MKGYINSNTNRLNKHLAAGNSSSLAKYTIESEDAISTGDDMIKRIHLVYHSGNIDAFTCVGSIDISNISILNSVSQTYSKPYHIGESCTANQSIVGIGVAHSIDRNGNTVTATGTFNIMYDKYQKTRWDGAITHYNDITIDLTFNEPVYTNYSTITFGCSSDDVDNIVFGSGYIIRSK